MQSVEIQDKLPYIIAVSAIIVGVVGVGFGFLTSRLVRYYDECIIDLYKKCDEYQARLVSVEKDVEWIKKELDQ